MKLLRRVFSLPVLLCAALVLMAAFGLACVGAGVFLLAPSPAAIEMKAETALPAAPGVAQSPADQTDDATDAPPDSTRDEAVQDETTPEVTGKAPGDASGETCAEPPQEEAEAGNIVPDADEVVFLVPQIGRAHV